jgi:hypothetical protein
MTSVTFPTAIGGDGSTVSDDNDPTTGLGNDGHRTRFIPALQQTVALVNFAVESLPAATSITSTSTTSLLISVASKTFTTQAGKQFPVGQFIIASSAANTNNFMYGRVTSYSDTTLIMDVLVINGSGTFADWNITISGTRGPAGTNIAVKDEGTTLTSTVDSMNFVGLGVTATQVANAVTVTIPAVAIKDEGTSLTTTPVSIDFTGIGVTATQAANAVTVAVNPTKGNRVELSRQVISSSVATVNFTSFISSTYASYEVELLGVQPASSSNLYMRTSTNNGSTYDAGTSYNYGTLNLRMDGSAALVTTNVAAAAQIIITANGANISQNGTAGVYGLIKLLNPTAAARFMAIWDASFVSTSSNSVVRIWGGGNFVTEQDVDAFQFLFSTGNIASGTFILYGIVKT